MTLQSKGSVKDLYKNNDSFYFQFSDRYSIFDWGEMPDSVPKKGAALAVISACFFEHLKRNSVKTHFLGCVDKEFEIQTSMSSKVTGFKFSPAKVLRPIFSKSGAVHYPDLAGDHFIPLEVIFRFGVPEGSSATQYHEVGTRFQSPMIEFTTKLEKQDRKLSEAEAQKISGLSERNFIQLKAQTVEVAKLVQTLLAQLQIELWDGKFEFALLNEEIVLVDSIGPDELRIDFQNTPVSKEILRKWYRSSGWYADLVSAKKQFGSDWKSRVQTQPQRLSQEQISCVSEMYKALANELCEVTSAPQVFKPTGSLFQWIDKYRSVL